MLTRFTARTRRLSHRTVATLRRQEDGFTLVEILVAFLLVAIALAVGVPYLLGLQRNSHDSAAKQELGKIGTAEQVYMHAGGGATTGDFGSLAQLEADKQSNYTPTSGIIGSPNIVAGSDSNSTSWYAVVEAKSKKFWRMDSWKPEAYQVLDIAGDPLP